MDFAALVVQYVKPEFIIVAVMCYVIGLFMKQSTVKDWVIPFVLLGFGIVFSILYAAVGVGLGFTGKAVLEGFTQGIICSALAVFTNQLVKQGTEKRLTE